MKTMPVIKIYEKPFGVPVSLSVQPVFTILNGETFATHESLLVAIDHESAPLEPSKYVKEVAASMGMDTDGVQVSDLVKRVLKRMFSGFAEVDTDGTKVINLTRLCIEFGHKINRDAEVTSLDPVSQERVLIGVMTLIAFIRDECTFEIATEQGSVMEYRH